MLAASIVIFIYLIVCALHDYLNVMLRRWRFSFQDCWCAGYSFEHKVQNLSPEKYSAYFSIMLELLQDTRPSQALHRLLLLSQPPTQELLECSLVRDGMQMLCVKVLGLQAGSYWPGTD